MPENLYPVLLNGIFDKLGLKKTADQESFISRLRSPAQTLKWEYHNDKVTAQYAAIEAQAAYLLRYLLPYSQFLPRVLGPLYTTGQHKLDSALGVCFVGTGPSPEIIGLGQFLSSRSSGKASPHTIRLIDRNNTDWAFARSVVFGTLVPRFSSLTEIQIAETAIDVSSEPAIRGPCDLIVFQNCLNEIAGANRFDINKLAAWAGALKKGGFLILIDRPNYPIVDAFLSDAAKSLPKNGYAEVARSSGNVNAHKINAAMPAAINEKLFYYASNGWIDRNTRPETNGLILKNDWPYLFSVYVRS